MVWTPKEFIIIRVKQDKIFIKEMVGKCDFFWKTHIVPEIL